MPINFIPDCLQVQKTMEYGLTKGQKQAFPLFLTIGTSFAKSRSRWIASQEADDLHDERSLTHSHAPIQAINPSWGNED